MVRPTFNVWIFRGYKSLIGFERCPHCQHWISAIILLFLPCGCHCCNCNLQPAYTNANPPPVVFSYALRKANHVLCVTYPKLHESSSAAKTIQSDPKIQRVFVFSMMPDYWKSKFYALMMPMLMMMTYSGRTLTRQDDAAVQDSDPT